MKPITLNPHEMQWQHVDGKLWIIRPLEPKLIAWHPELGACYRHGRFLPPELYLKHFCPYGKPGKQLYSRETWCEDPNDPEKTLYRGPDSLEEETEDGRPWLVPGKQPWYRARFSWILEERMVVNLLDLPDEFYDNCGCPPEVLNVKPRRKSGLIWYANRKEWFISNWREAYPHTWEQNRACWILKVRQIPRLTKKWVNPNKKTA